MTALVMRHTPKGKPPVPTFNIGDLANWVPCAPGQAFKIEPGPSGERRFECAVVLAYGMVVLASHPELQEAEGELPCVVAIGDGLHEIKFTVRDPIWLSFAGEENAIASVRFKDASQLLPEDDEASFTTIEPRTRGPNDEVRRLMQLMQYNLKKRDDMLAQQQRENRDLIEAIRAEKEPKQPAELPAPPKEDKKSDPSPNS